MTWLPLLLLYCMTIAVTLAVGLAGAGSRRGPGGLGAEVYAVDLDLAREGDAWRVSWAQWHAAPATDLL